jgi:hypothetical protein
MTCRHRQPNLARHPTAANYEAKAELLQARLGYLLAWEELERTIGRAPELAAQ